jgi:hypothetical protein
METSKGMGRLELKEKEKNQWIFLSVAVVYNQSRQK